MLPGREGLSDARVSASDAHTIRVDITLRSDTFGEAEQILFSFVDDLNDELVERLGSTVKNRETELTTA